MNAALKVPSANNRLNVLGSLKATKKASANIDAPKKNAIKILICVIPDEKILGNNFLKKDLTLLSDL